VLTGKGAAHRLRMRVFSLADEVPLLTTRGLVPSEVGLLVVGQARWPQQAVKRTEGGALVRGKVKKCMTKQRGTIGLSLSPPLTGGWNRSKGGVLAAFVVP